MKHGCFRLRSWLVGAAALIGAGLAAPPAEALTIMNPPVDKALNVFVGVIVGVGKPVVVYEEWFTKKCYFRDMTGDTSGLTDDHGIDGSRESDLIQMIAPNSGLEFCGAQLWGIQPNGHWVDLHGMSGNDRLGGSIQPTWLWGFDGNDTLWSGLSWALMAGHGGNDKLESHNNLASDERHYGGDGDDCFWDFNQRVNILECGNGHDRHMSISPTDPAGFSTCEMHTNSC
jgi:hypothetical protein